MKHWLLLLLLLSTGNVLSQKKAYVLFNNKGKKVSYKKMIRTVQKSDVLLFGEFHNNPITHWLQYELTDELNQSNTLILGAEMIERDNQKALDQYLKGEIDHINNNGKLMSIGYIMIMSPMNFITYVINIKCSMPWSRVRAFGCCKIFILSAKLLAPLS